MPVVTQCSRCFRIITFQEKKRGLCPTCYTAAEQVRNATKLARRRRDGRNTKQWQQIRQWVLARDDNRCQVCDQPGTIVDKITAGYHIADPSEYRTLCHQCSGRIDGRRAAHTHRPL
jgi:hypothetical protein